MEQRSNFRLGLFILVAITLAAGLMIALGSGKWFRQQFMLETYFNESVQGLDIGSKVRYRGVVVGEISAITFTYARYQQALPSAQRYQYVLIESRLNTEMMSGKGFPAPTQATLDAEIAKGLRVKIAPQGVTGTSYLEIDYMGANAGRPLPIAWTPEQLYIPSSPSTVNQIVTATQNLIAKMQHVDIEQTMARLDQLLLTAEQKLAPLPLLSMSEKMNTVLDHVGQLPLASMAKETQALLLEARQTNQALQEILTQPGWRSAPADLAIAAESAKKIATDPQIASTLQRIDRVSQRLDRLSSHRETDVDALIEQLSSASLSLQQLLNKAEQQPSQLLFSNPPPVYTPPKP
ncbi:MlaD family protein [Deefgea salmonis]|uniref:MlaD family protein n=1 Tax=Deefgea salmonis TaxID=2875502 RepID=A0ABS8BKT3_9NEIS|nr:MlaD family protein [Deefgea salmonis]MCB5196330.1 MlaD family protein [Deefgea salmonis]